MGEESTPAKKKFSFSVKTLLLGIIVLLVLLAGWSTFSYFQAQKKISELSTSAGQQQLAKEQVDALVAKVEKHMVLPKDETPTVATITDIASLKKSQPFFDGAQNGDQVLVYAGAKKAIIYSPSRDIIVNVGFVSVDNAGATSANAQAPLSVEVRNGTGTAGLAQQVANTLKSDGYTIQKTTDAKSKDYTTTEVINTGKSQDTAGISALAQAIGAQVVTLPAGETTSTADVIVIVGADKAAQ